MRFLVLGLLLACSCASVKVTGWVAVAGASMAADVAATQTALDRGATEVNPVLGKRPTAARMVAVNAAVFAVIYFMTKDLPVETQSKVWRFMAAYHLGCTAWNVSQTPSTAQP